MVRHTLLRGRQLHIIAKYGPKVRIKIFKMSNCMSFEFNIYIFFKNFFRATCYFFVG